MSSGLTADPRFVQGNLFMKEKRYDEAIEFFSNLLQTATKTHGDEGVETAPVWFVYGNALLAKEEENPSDDLLGVAAAEAKKAAAELSKELGADAENEEKAADEDEDEDEKGVEEGEGEGEGEGEEERDDSDMAVAWEALEMSRRIYSSNQCAEFDPPLAETHSRLGDLLRFNGNFEGAIAEYSKCLELRQSFLPANDRQLSETHFLIAISHVYNSSEDGRDAKTEKKKALKHYSSARDVLTEALKAVSASDAAAESELERRETLDELTETITALKAELRALEPSAAAATRIPQTQSFGFGFPKAPASDSAAVAGSAPMVVQAKKKIKLSDSTEASDAPTGGVGEETKSSTDAEKR